MTLQQRHGFLLLPRFSLLSFGGVTDALTAANELQGEVAYRALGLHIHA